MGKPPLNSSVAAAIVQAAKARGIELTKAEDTRTANPKATSIPNKDFLPEVRQNFCIMNIDGASVAEPSIFSW
jgi:hypothetical protein